MHPLGSTSHALQDLKMINQQWPDEQKEIEEKFAQSQDAKVREEELNARLLKILEILDVDRPFIALDETQSVLAELQNLKDRINVLNISNSFPRYKLITLIDHLSYLSPQMQTSEIEEKVNRITAGLPPNCFFVFWKLPHYLENGKLKNPRKVLNDFRDTLVKLGNRFSSEHPQFGPMITKYVESLSDQSSVKDFHIAAQLIANINLLLILENCVVNEVGNEFKDGAKLFSLQNLPPDPGKFEEISRNARNWLSRQYNINKIEVHSKAITLLPPDFGELQLDELDFSGCSFFDLPHGFVHSLPSRINFSDNDFAYIPQCINNDFSHLRYVDFSNNHLTGFFDEDGDDLAEATYLSLKNNPDIKDLSGLISMRNTLQEFECDRFHLRFIPDQFIQNNLTLTTLKVHEPDTIIEWQRASNIPLAQFIADQKKAQKLK